MKKLLSLAAVVVGLSAYQVDIKSDWQLKGALEDINATDVFNKQEIISVWTWQFGKKERRRGCITNFQPDQSSIKLSVLNI